METNDFLLEYFTQIFHGVKESIPRLNSDTSYWFVRANGGIFYNSFNVGNYIAIGWNAITLEDLNDLSEVAVKEKIKEYHHDIEKPGSPYNQMMRFAFNLRIGDIVIVPSEAPNDLLVGVITSRPYTATDEEIQSETNVCPYNKRIKVSWKGVIKNENIDPQLYKLVYSGHTISDASQYKKFINRGLFDAYIDEYTSESLMSITFKIKEKEDISAIDFNRFISTIIQMAEILADDNSKLKSIQIRTNVQSPGPLEFLGDPEIMTGISIVLSWTFNFSVLGVGAVLINKIISKGGKISLKNGEFHAEITSKGDEEKKIAEASALNSQTYADKIKTVLEVVHDPTFQETAKKLNIDTPDEVHKSIITAIKKYFDINQR